MQQRSRDAWAVKRIGHPRGAFDALERSGADAAAMQALVRNIVASQKFDLYVVVNRSGAAFSGTNQTVTGLGIVHAGSVINPDNVHLYALIAVQVFDGHTFDRLAWQRAEFQIGAAMRAINGPSRALDQTWWPATPQATAQSDKLKSATRALVEQGLGATIPEIMGLKVAERAGEPSPKR